MEVDVTKLSPMMQQYWQVKNQYREHILFFRVGDFYEMFFDDALIASKLLELTLTGKDCGMEERAPMCGIPHHACDIYIKRLIENGQKVAVCEQLTDPNESKGIVVRDVVKVVTPGTLTDSSMLDDSSNNYIGAVYVNDKADCSVCFADISTGAVNLFTKTGGEAENELINELARYSPAEILFNQDFLLYKNASAFIQDKLNASVQLLDDDKFDPNLQKETILRQFTANDFSDLGLNDSDINLFAVSALFYYISETQKTLTGRFTEIKIFNENKFMGLNLTARRNLELTETMRNKERKGTLLWVLDHTKTSMGKRLLKTYLEQPLIQPAAIISRLDSVEQLCRSSVIHSEITDYLSKVYDLERLMTRVMYKTATPRDLKSLSVTASQLPGIKNLLGEFSASLLKKYNEDIDPLNEISALIENSIIDEPPVSVKDGGVIKDGFHKELDEYRHILKSGKNIITEIEERERSLTGIKNLKIGYNRVFGYYIEVTKSYYDLIPESYIRKQTLANCERFITEELKNVENKILTANEKVLVLEAEIFSEIRDFIATQLEKVQKTAAAVAGLDVLCSFASVSMKNQYVKPEISIDGMIEIKDGRHPVVELMLDDEMFVPNDTLLDLNSNRMSVITGPNMSGKSTYMRQVALITLMAQIGCFVPASHARISIVDQIFTRVGASDDLTAGQSTFMVEMSEVADILRHATKNSLVILDEVGRGTSTFDGISIAKAVAEQIAVSRGLGCKTLFATHYHELISLEDEIDGIKNYSVAVKKRGENIKFLRKIVRGGVDDSYGIEVAKLAGIPKKVTDRAKELLEKMETENLRQRTVVHSDQISFSALNHECIIEKLRKTNIEELSDEDIRYLLRELLSML